MPDDYFTIATDPDSQDIALLNQKAGVKQTGVQMPLGIFVRGTEDQVIGGIYGWIAEGWLYVDTLWLHESLRGQDYGTRLLRAMEQAAVERGIDRCYLMTLGFQARPFYEKQGYTVFFTQEDFLAGYAVYGQEIFLREENRPVARWNAARQHISRGRSAQSRRCAGAG